MAFQSTSKKFGGEGYTGDIHTVQDLEADPTGNTIYAEGTLTVTKRGIAFGTAANIDYDMNNRGYHKENGRVWYTPPFFTADAANACLHHLFIRMTTMGKNK